MPIFSIKFNLLVTCRTCISVKLYKVIEGDFMKNLERLVRELCKIEAETEWLEFKCSNYSPDMIGADISALANGATLKDKDAAYMIWGVDDKTHAIIGTEKSLHECKVGRQELENWLLGVLSDNVDFQYGDVTIDGKRVGILTIKKAFGRTVKFKKEAFIRVGSYTKKLHDVQSLEGLLWDKLRNEKFELQLVKQDLKASDALKCLDYDVYFRLLHQSNIPRDDNAILHYLIQEHMIIKQDNGLYAVTNLGGIVLAKDFGEFSGLSRKSVRIVRYTGMNRMAMERDETFNAGYAVVFEGIMKYILGLIPVKEVFRDGIRRQIAAYSMEAIREAIANALIHQDFTITGMGPLIEVFEDRIEITNPGDCLVDVKRIIDNPPRSRNEQLAAVMRRMGFCEELGSGWDRIVLLSELMQLPTPRIDVYEGGSTRVTIFRKIDFFDLNTEDKLWACYMHACIQYVQGDKLTNASLRKRFGLEGKSAGSISRLIKLAVEEKYIKVLDPTTAPRYMKYVPIWA